jgi:potassium efflux system protein
LVTLVLLVVTRGLACGQTAPAAPEVTAAAVSARIAEVEQQVGLDETTRTAMLERLREALGHTQRFEESTVRLIEFNRLTAEAPTFLEQIRAELASPAPEPKPEVGADPTLGQLEQGLAQAKAELQTAREQADYWQAETSRRVERRPVVLDLVSQLRKRVSELDEELRGLAQSEITPLIEARSVSLRAHRGATLREIEALEAEIRCYDARRDITPARRDRALRQVTQAEKLIAIFERLVSEKRQSDARDAALRAESLRLDAAREHPALQDFANETKRLADLRVGPGGTTEKIDLATAELKATNADLAGMRSGYQSVRRRIAATGLNRATGLLLRQQFEALPNISDLHRSLRVAREELEAAHVSLIERQDERAAAGDINSAVESLTQLRGAAESESARVAFEAVARDLAVNRRDTLDRLVADASTNFDLRIDIEAATQEYLDASIGYERFIEERILWIRSISTAGFPAIGDFAGATRSALDAEAWRTAARLTWSGIAEHVSRSASLALLVLSAFLLSVRSRMEIRRTASAVGSYRTDSLAHTFRAIGWTLVGALPVPLLLYAGGYLIASPAEQVPLAVALSQGLQSAALLALPIIAGLHLAGPGGVLEAHLRWPSAALRSLRHHLHWFIVPALISFGLVEAIERLGDEAVTASLGRLTFSVQLGLISLFLGCVLRRRGPVMVEYLKRREGSPLDRFFYVWYLLLLVMPLGFACISWMGYHYTALELGSRFRLTLRLAMLLVFVNGLLQRWLFLARRRVAVENARRRREQAKSEGGSAGASADGAAPIDESKLDLPAISAQTQQLFRLTIVVSLLLGVYLIWASVLPALKLLDRVELWPQVRIVERDRLDRVSALELTDEIVTGQTAPPPAAAERDASEAPPSMMMLPSTSSESKVSVDSAPVVLTLADVGLGLIVLLATVLAFRNLPGLVEIVVLQRLPLDAGSRYALSTVLRYLIAVVGITVAFNTIGISWSKVQWLAAALTFGLAFGLQEIFANFVSGLIILAERPIRVGDTVTVGGVSGNVARIRMRATTITDWDRKELIIPNRTFITDQVINWTLTDGVLRVVVPVGVSYDSDVERVERLLLDVAIANPLILRDPPPQALFLGFGDSTLNFELRCHIGAINNFVAARHQLHGAILSTFRKHDVEISFPQRDLHLRTSDATIQIVSSPAPSGPTTSPLPPTKLD